MAASFMVNVRSKFQVRYFKKSLGFCYKTCNKLYFFIFEFAQMSQYNESQSLWHNTYNMMNSNIVFTTKMQTVHTFHNHLLPKNGNFRYRLHLMVWKMFEAPIYCVLMNCPEQVDKFSFNSQICQLLKCLGIKPFLSFSSSSRGFFTFWAILAYCPPSLKFIAEA